MARQRRLKILDKNNEVRPELDPDYGPYENALESWIDDVIPPVPPGTLCEAERCITQTTCEEESDGYFCALLYNHEGDCWFLLYQQTKRPFAESYRWVVTDGHVCYTYVCWECAEAMADDCDPLETEDYPTTNAGYAITPTRCET